MKPWPARSKPVLPIDQVKSPTAARCCRCKGPATKQVVLNDDEIGFTLACNACTNCWEMLRDQPSATVPRTVANVVAFFQIENATY